MQQPRRFKIYAISYIIAVIIFLLNIFGPLSQSFLFLSFALASFFLVFTIEFTPTEGYENPQVHLYEKAKFNSYTYSMIILFILSALAYYILTGIFQMNAGLAIIIIWPINIFAANQIYLRTAPNIPIEIINDYLQKTLGISPSYDENKILNELIKKLLPTLYGDRSKKDLKKLEDEFEKKGLNEDFFEKAVIAIEQYLDLAEDPLSSDEVFELEQENKENSSTHYTRYPKVKSKK